MATTFAFHLYGMDATYARRAAKAAFELVDNLEQVLSYFLAGSDVSRLNRAAAGAAVPVGPDTLECLTIAQQAHEATGGAFDVTVGAMLAGREPWDASEQRGEPYQPSTGPLAVGMELIAINAELGAVARRAANVEIDLGGIGKGYALDQAAAMLRDWGATRAMLSAGESTMLTLSGGGAGEEERGKKEERSAKSQTLPGAARGAHVQEARKDAAEPFPMRLIDPRDERTVLGTFALSSGAVSVSSSPVGQEHVLDPATGEPARGRLAAWALAPTAAWADALSTAFLLMPADAIERLCAERPGICAMLLHECPQGLRLQAFGRWERLTSELTDQPAP